MYRLIFQSYYLRTMCKQFERFILLFLEKIFRKRVIFQQSYYLRTMCKQFENTSKIFLINKSVKS